MSKISGPALIAIGLLHSLVAIVMPGAVGFSGIWQEIIDVGVIDATSVDPLHIWGFYWFLISGFLTIFCGLLCDWIENRLNCPLPLFAGWGLLALAGFGIVLDIDTGFWLVLLVAVNAIIGRSKTIAASQRANSLSEKEPKEAKKSP